ncbi:unnamed protein product [marine sediment metagenome]|uniref:Uncharacterized protein n=1 Tax=marine sediment metagenome TaxID=412755 RepID=X0YU40_9ZZZZ
MDFTNYSPTFVYFNQWLDDLNKQIKRSRELFIKHYKRKYTGIKYFPIHLSVANLG